MKSKALAGSDTQRRLLEYLFQKSQGGEADGLKEYTIGVEALGKPAAYDPREDSVVRLQLLRLRQKLDSYYLGEGAADAVQFILPKGCFRLEISTRRVITPEEFGQLRRKFRAITAALLCLLAVSVIGALIATHTSIAANTDRQWSDDLHALWRPVLQSKRPLVLCIGSPVFVQIPGKGYFRDHKANAEGEAAESPRVKTVSEAFGVAAVRPWHNFTLFGDAGGTFLVARLIGSAKPDMQLTRGSSLTWEDIVANDVIFVGPPKFTPGLNELLAGQQFVLDPGGVRNLHPRPGEAAFYGHEPDPNVPEDGVSYGLITFLSGVHREGTYVILAGSVGPDSVAAAQWMTGAKQATALAARLRSGGRMPGRFQVIVRVRFRNFVPLESSYVTHRTLAD